MDPQQQQQQQTTATATPSQKQLSKDEVHKFLKSAVDLAIGSGEYHHRAVSELQNNITQYAIKKIGAVKPASTKCVVTCTVVQNTDAGFHITNALHWDDSCDTVVTYNFQNKAMNIVLTAYLITT
ncbi:hypothetical protein LPJ72_005175 [Coemansia sp. Benny D160-2]|nr:hypothetical protein LPJ72_005175 [Coemansia sp. Benny D160-2]